MGAGIGALYALSGFAGGYSDAKMQQKQEKLAARDKKDRMEMERIKGLIQIIGDPDIPGVRRQSALEAYMESPYGGRDLIKQGIDLPQIVKGFEQGSRPQTITPPIFYRGPMPDGSVARPQADPQLHPYAGQQLPGPAVRAYPRRNVANAFAQGQAPSGPPTQAPAGPPTQPQVSAGPPVQADVSTAPSPFPQADVEQTITQALGPRPQNEFDAMRWDSAATKMRQDITGRYFQQRFEKRFAPAPALTPYIVTRSDGSQVPAYIDRQTQQLRDFTTGEAIVDVESINSVGTDRQSSITAYRDFREGALERGIPPGEVPHEYNKMISRTRPAGMGLFVSGYDQESGAPILAWVPPGQRRGEEPPEITRVPGITKQPPQHPLAKQIQQLERDYGVGTGTLHRRLGKLSFARQGVEGKSAVEARAEGRKIYQEYLQGQGRGRSLAGGPPEQRSKEDERVDELIKEMKGGKR